MSQATPKNSTHRVKLLRIIDGDTVEVQQKGVLRSHPKERIRLWGIDAPESSQKGGPESTKYLRKITGRRKDIWLTRMDVDQYGRTVGIIHPDHHTLNTAYNYEMVRGGHAHCYMLSGPGQARYQAAEAEAREKRLGLWRDRNPQVPRQFRVKEEKKASTGRKLRIAFALILIAAALFAVLYYYSSAGG